MIVKYRKTFFSDIQKIKNLKAIEEIEFLTDIANNAILRMRSLVLIG